MTFGEEGIGILIVIGFIFAILIPFLAGSLLSYFILKRTFIYKKNKNYLKEKRTRIIVSILISIIFGYLSLVFFGRDINNFIVNLLSK